MNGFASIFHVFFFVMFILFLLLFMMFSHFSILFQRLESYFQMLKMPIISWFQSHTYWNTVRSKCFEQKKKFLMENSVNEGKAKNIRLYNNCIFSIEKRLLEFFSGFFFFAAMIIWIWGISTVGILSAFHDFRRIQNRLKVQFSFIQKCQNWGNIEGSNIWYSFIWKESGCLWNVQHLSIKNYCGTR